MRCQSVEACVEEIQAYARHTPPTGLPLFVNTEDYDAYNELVSRFWADQKKEIVRVSNTCTGDDGLPRVSEAEDEAFGAGCHILVGISQAERLFSKQHLRESMDTLLSRATKGYTIVLLEHVEEELASCLRADLRLVQRVILLDDGRRSPLPQLRLLKEEEAAELCAETLVQGMKGLLVKLESLRDADVAGHGEIVAVTQKPAAMFCQSVYTVQTGLDAYARLLGQQAELGDVLERTFGTEEEWRWLWGKLRSRSLAELVSQDFGDASHLEMCLADVLSSSDEKRKWLYFIALKAFSVQNAYLAAAMRRTHQVQELMRVLYGQLLEEAAFSKREDTVRPEFWQRYKERERLLKNVEVPAEVARAYASDTGVKGKAALCYLSSRNEDERYQIIKCLSDYEYGAGLLQDILHHVAPVLAAYLAPYHFFAAQAGLADDKQALCDKLSAYFAAYRRQKLCNSLEPQFLQEVEQLAEERPYNRFLPRVKVLKELACAEDVAYFFDALGVEYIPFIAARAKRYGMMANIRLARAELPTITAMNTEDFKTYFKKPCKDIKALDECKHNIQRYDYEKVSEPYHIYEELGIIDKVLRDIYRTMCQQKLARVILVSDHGASRLAVLAGHESSSLIEVDGTRGEHSGRCCKTEYDRKIPKAAYEHGYEVLANYDRFRGSRKADVEVHGGASFEEVLVPVIALQLYAQDVEYAFEEDGKVHIKRQEPTRLKLYCNQEMREPGLMVKGKLYHPVRWNGKQHAVFELPDIKRCGRYEAEVYEGNGATGKKLPFELVKETHEVDFGF